MTPPIWSGTLARGGRVVDEFRAEIHVVNGKPVIVERTGTFATNEVQPAEVRGDYWLMALVELAQGRSR